ncbi:MAG: RNA pseudouridine synthase [Verrucomicrobiota bacterium]
MNFRIIDETDAWIVIDKPPGLLIHPKKPDGPPTVWDGLRQLLAFELANGGQVSIVNRLDRETSGLVLVCKTAQAARQFGLAMLQRAFSKQYLAIVWGWPATDEFSVDAPMLRQGDRLSTAIYLKRCVHPEGAPAFTRFKVERRFERENVRFSLVRAFPETGRTHQIRVHLAHAGHPIVGDKIYGPDERCYLEFIETGWTPRLEERLLLPRHALHSAVLGVRMNGEALEWNAPIAEDLATWMLHCSNARC